MHIVMHTVMNLLADTAAPDISEFKSVIARAMIVITLAAVASFGGLLAFNFFRHMFGSEDQEAKAKAGIRRAVIGFAGVALAIPIQAVLYWIFADAIAKRLA